MNKYGLSSDHGRDIVVIFVIFAIIAILSSVFRLWSKHIKQVAYKSEDAFLVGALAVMVPFLGLGVASVTEGGVGYHAITEVPVEDLQYALKLLIPLEVCYGLLVSLVKTSILLFYRRIFSPHNSFRAIIAALITIIWLWGISTILTAFLLCRPFRFNWGVGEGTCGNRVASFVANGAINMLTDAMMLILPLPYIFSLQMSVWKKFGIAAWFCLGVFVSAISIIRMLALVRLNLDDYTYNVPNALMWSLLECQLAILVANIPFIRPVLVPCFSRLASTITGGDSNRSGLNDSGRVTNAETGRVADSAFGRTVDVWGPSNGRKTRKERGKDCDGDIDESVMDFGVMNEAYGLNALGGGKKGSDTVIVGGREFGLRGDDVESVDSQVQIAERGAAPGTLY